VQVRCQSRRTGQGREVGIECRKRMFGRRAKDPSRKDSPVTCGLSRRRLVLPANRRFPFCTPQANVISSYSHVQILHPDSPSPLSYRTVRAVLDAHTWLDFAIKIRKNMSNNPISQSSSITMHMPSTGRYRRASPRTCTSSNSRASHHSTTSLSLN